MINKHNKSHNKSKIEMLKNEKHIKPNESSINLIKHKLSETYQKLIQSKPWKQQFKDSISNHITQSDSQPFLPKSIDQIGSSIMKQEVFWIMWIETILKTHGFTEIVEIYKQSLDHLASHQSIRRHFIDLTISESKLRKGLEQNGAVKDPWGFFICKSQDSTVFDQKKARRKTTNAIGNIEGKELRKKFPDFQNPRKTIGNSNKENLLGLNSSKTKVSCKSVFKSTKPLTRPISKQDHRVKTEGVSRKLRPRSSLGFAEEQKANKPAESPVQSLMNLTPIDSTENQCERPNTSRDKEEQELQSIPIDTKQTNKEFSLRASLNCPEGQATQRIKDIKIQAQPRRNPETENENSKRDQMNCILNSLKARRFTSVDKDFQELEQKAFDTNKETEHQDRNK